MCLIESKKNASYYKQNQSIYIKAENASDQLCVLMSHFVYTNVQ